MGKRTFTYAEAIYFNSLPNHVKSATSVNMFEKDADRVFYLIILIYLLACTFNIDLAKFFTVLLFLS